MQSYFSRRTLYFLPPFLSTDPFSGANTKINALPIQPIYYKQRINENLLLDFTELL